MPSIDRDDARSASVFDELEETPLISDRCGRRQFLSSSSAAVGRSRSLLELASPWRPIGVDFELFMIRLQLWSCNNQNLLPRILEKQNWLQMSQVFFRIRTLSLGGFAFQGFYERDRGT